MRTAARMLTSVRRAPCSRFRARTEYLILSRYGPRGRYWSSQASYLSALYAVSSGSRFVSAFPWSEFSEFKTGRIL